MNVELTIQNCFDNYPCLFKERADVLNHLFCTLGNGYKWINGELVGYTKPSENEIQMLKSHLVCGKAFQHNKLSLRAELQFYEDARIAEGWYEEWHKKYPDEDIEKLKAMRQEAINQFPDDVYYKEPLRKKRWYFYVNISGREHIDFFEEFVFLFNYPDDIKPDWKDAIEECKRLLVEDGFELPC